MKLRCVVAILVGCLLAVKTAEARKWQDRSGKFSVEAELVKRVGGKVHLKKANGVVVAVPIARLSIEDQEYLAKNPPKRKTIRTALTERTVVEFVRAPLREVVDYLSQVHNIPFFFDKKGLRDADIGTDAPITMNIKGNNLAEVLDAMLKPLDLTWLVKHQVLFITTNEAASQMLETRIYRPLKGPNAFAFLRDIPKNIAPQSWDEVGGPGSAAATPFGAIAVSNTYAVHRRIAKHYSQVLQWTGSGLVPASSPIEKTLQQNTILEFLETPLKEVLEFLKAQHQVSFTIDKKAFDGVGLQTEVPITESLRGIRLSSALPLMLLELDVAWAADKNSIRLTMPEDLRQDVQLKRYPVKDLADGQQGRQLIELITTLTAPDNWDAVGGLGQARIGAQGTLDVRQDPATHRQVAQLLADLRVAKKAMAAGR